MTEAKPSTPSTLEQVGKLHVSAQYSMQIRQEYFSVKTGRGIKPGCKLAPLLWSALTTLITDRYRVKWGDSSLDDLTIFADDNLLHVRFLDQAGLEQAIDKCNFLLDLLSQLGLTVNAEKSQALLSLRGTGAASARSRHMATLKRQQVLVLSSDRKIPIKSEITYLGAQLSYHNYQDSSLRVRLAAARSTYRQLRTILRSSRSISLQKECKCGGHMFGPR